MSVTDSQAFGFMEASPDAQPAFAPCCRAFFAPGADAEPSLPKLCQSQLPQRKGKVKSDISECAAMLHNCESKPGEFSPSVSEQAQARKLRKISLNPLS